MNRHTEHYGALLRTFRERQNLSQTELAERVNIRQGTVSRLEGGKKVSRDLLIRIGAVLRLDTYEMSQLLVQAGYSPVEELDMRHPVLLRLGAMLQNSEMMQVVEPLGIGRIIMPFVEAWELFGASKKAQYSRDWHGAIQLAQTALEKIEASALLMQAYLYDTQGTAHIHTGGMLEAEQLYHVAAGQLNGLKDPYLRGIIHTHEGDWYRSSGRWREALAKYEIAQGEFADGRDIVKNAWIHRKKGVLYLSQSDVTKAMPELRQSRTLLTAVDANHPQHEVAQYELARLSIALGWAYNLIGDWEQSIEVRLQTLEIAKTFRVLGKTRDDYLIMRAHFLLGYDLVLVGALEAATYHLEVADTLSNTLQERRQRGAVLLGLARLSLAKGQRYWMQAETFFQQSLEIHQITGDRLKIMRTLTYYAMLDIARGYWKEALEKLWQAEAKATNFNNTYYRVQIALLICQVCHRTERFELVKQTMESVMPIVAQMNGLYPHLRARFSVMQAEIAMDQRQEQEALSYYVEALAATLQVKDNILIKMMVSETETEIRAQGYVASEVVQAIHRGLQLKLQRSTYGETLQFLELLKQTIRELPEKSLSSLQIKEASEKPLHEILNALIIPTLD